MAEHQQQCDTIRASITHSEGGFSPQRQTLFNYYLKTLSQELGMPPTGVAFSRSINHLSIQDVVALGDTFSSRSVDMGLTASGLCDNDAQEAHTTSTIPSSSGLRFSPNFLS